MNTVSKIGALFLLVFSTVLLYASPMQHGHGKKHGHGHGHGKGHYKHAKKVVYYDAPRHHYRHHHHKSYYRPVRTHERIVYREYRRPFRPLRPVIVVDL